MSDPERIKIHLFHKLPTPYNDMLFHALHAREDVDLLVHHLWKSRSNRPWTVELATGYPNHYLKTVFGVDWGLVKTALLERESFFIVGDWAHIPAITVLLVRILMRTPVSIWADTPQEQLHRPWYKRIPRHIFLDWLLPNMDVVFGTGKPGTGTLITMGVPEEKVENLPCYVELDHPNNNSHQVKRSKFRKMVGCEHSGTVFLMSGMCTYKKGQDIGIRAFASCLHETGENVGLVIAGDGPECDNLRGLVEELKISDRIAFLGWLDPDEMNAAYAACDVFVHTARWDPFPLVILEGMSWGKVVIGSDVCGSVQDRIIDSVNGFVFPSEDVDALTSIMKDIVLHPEKITAIGAAARKTAEEWPVERGVETIVQTARQVLSKHRQ